jgi:hypothetical protein
LYNNPRGGPAPTLETLRDAADVVWLVAGDSYRSGNRLLTCVQNQLGRLAGNLAFSVENEGLIWRAADARTSADEVVAAWPRSADRPERHQAAAWLTEMLAHGPIEAQRLFDECHQCRLSQRTVRRAAAELGLHPIKIGQGGPWLWGFDNGAAPSALDPPVVQDVAALPEAGNLADSAVMQVELRSDAAPNMAIFEPVGNLPNSAEPAPEVAGDAARAKRGNLRIGWQSSKFGGAGARSAGRRGRAKRGNLRTSWQSSKFGGAGVGVAGRRSRAKRGDL